MIRKFKRPHRLKCFYFLFGLIMLSNVNSVSADTHLSVQVSEPLAFRDYFWIDRGFGGLLSDFIELADGNYSIEVFGPPGKPPFPHQDMFYVLTINVKVQKSIPIVQSVSFNSYCDAKGIEVQVKEVPTPAITNDMDFPNAYRLVIKSPILAERETPCRQSSHKMMAVHAQIGVLKLFTTSVPVGAEVWVDGKVIGKTNSTINVPYRRKEKRIGVVIRRPGYVNCKWTLKEPFKEDAYLHCEPKTP